MAHELEGGENNEREVHLERRIQEMERLYQELMDAYNDLMSAYQKVAGQ